MSGLVDGAPGSLVWLLLLSAALGAGFGATVGFEAGAYASTLAAGLVLGLLWWIAGPLTAAPLIAGRAPTWSLAEAAARFGELIGALLYGGITGLAFHVLAASAAARWPVAAPALGEPEPRARVVVLGGGFAGVSAVKRLERLFVRDPGIDVTLISPSNYLLFTPMLAEVASSALEARHISAPVRAACPRTRFRRAEVEAIDVGRRRVTLRTAPSAPPETIPYDHVVLALGSVPSFRGIPGLEQHAFTLKTLEDAERLRNHVIGRLERADTEPDPMERRRQVTFVVVGGGFAGVETAAELLDLVHGVMHYYPGIAVEEPRFVLVHRGEAILPELGRALGDYALATLSARGIEFRLEQSLERAGPGAVTLGDGAEVPNGTLVWTAGNNPHPLLGATGLELGRGGGVVVEPTLRARGRANVWAIGDCALVPDPENEGAVYPPTAQHALREGRAVADNLARALHGKRPRAFRFRALGLLVALGHRTAAAEIRGRRFSGLLAWLLWRGVYLGKLPGLERKLRVLFDWALDLAFARDIVLTRPAPERAGRPSDDPARATEAVPPR